MVKKSLSDVEKSLIDLNLNLIKETHSFNNKVFFAIISIIVGGFGLYLNKNPVLNDVFIGVILIGILFFLIQVTFSISDLNKDINDLIEKIIKSNNFEDYKIEKTKFLNKILFALPIGLLTFVTVLILSASFWWSLVGGIALSLVVLLSPRFY